VSLTRADTAEVRLSDLGRLPVADVDLLALKAAGLVPSSAKQAKVIKSGALDKAVSLTGVLATKGAKAAIEAAGGSVADIVAVVRPKKLPAKPAKTADA
jgi:large subunit ribosomal protein L15